MYKYTSDLHFGHEPIIKRCNRPFCNVEEMNKAIIRNFNENLDKDDILIIAGDIACHGYNPCKELDEIRCKKVLIVGNHDKSALSHQSFRKRFVDIREHEIIRDGEYKIYLSHYPMAEWDGFYRGIYHFYGHIHNSMQGAGHLMKLYPNAVNVGIDVNEFKPMTAHDLITRRKETYKAELPNVPKDFLEKVICIPN